MATAPQVGNTFWDVSKYFMDQMSHLLSKVNKKREQLSAKIICQLAITEYGGSMFDLLIFILTSLLIHIVISADVEACQDTLSTKNKMNLNFTLNLDDR
jgi:hypothetical protein